MQARWLKGGGVVVVAAAVVVVTLGVDAPFF